MGYIAIYYFIAILLATLGEEKMEFRVNWYQRGLYKKKMKSNMLARCVNSLATSV
jgi:hypothetical protein